MKFEPHVLVSSSLHAHVCHQIVSDDVNSPLNSLDFTWKLKSKAVTLIFLKIQSKLGVKLRSDEIHMKQHFFDCSVVILLVISSDKNGNL